MRQIRYSVANIYKSITITIPDGTTGSTFDIPLPVGTYTGGISVKLAIGDKECIAESTQNITISTGKMIEI